MRSNEERLEHVVGLLATSRRLLFVTGAGMSADSGLPTYRGVGGLYDTDVTEEGLPIEYLLSGAMMRSRPELTWKYLAQIANACRGATFNRGHQVIAEMERHFDEVCVLTQNVDGLHRQAGSRNVIDIHGDLHDLVCTACGRREMVDDLEGHDIPPRCPRCRAIVRPDVVLFGEALPEDKVARMRSQMDAGFDLVFSIGTTSVFPYIAEPIEHAARAGKPTVEINPDESEVSHCVAVRLAMPAAHALDGLWSRFQAR